MNPDNLQPIKVFTATTEDWEVLRRSSPEDFDGHTGFDRMAPAARLAWLETAVAFVVSATAHQRSHSDHSRH